MAPPFFFANIPTMSDSLIYRGQLVGMGPYFENGWLVGWMMMIDCTPTWRQERDGDGRCVAGRT